MTRQEERLASLEPWLKRCYRNVKRWQFGMPVEGCPDGYSWWRAVDEAEAELVELVGYDKAVDIRRKWNGEVRADDDPSQ